MLKFYVVDTGIRNALMGYSGGDLGHVLETVVYFELLRRGYQVTLAATSWSMYRTKGRKENK